MGKQPAFQFYPGDWLRDTQLQMVSFHTQGMWINILCRMWDAPERGILRGTVDQLAQLIHCKISDLETFLNENKKTKFANVTFCNEIVTIVNRRMRKEEKARITTRKRVAEFRKQICNANVQKCNKNVTAYTSSSSSIQKNNTIGGAAFFTCRYFTLTDHEADKYVSAYGLDRQQFLYELKKMELWLDNNPTKRKKSYGRFITNWISRGNGALSQVPQPDNGAGKAGLDKMLNDVRMRRAKLKAGNGGAEGLANDGDKLCVTGGDKRGKASGEKIPDTQKGL
jgi:hypothetical protein